MDRHLLKRDADTERLIFDLPNDDEHAPFVGVRCPQCGWQPDDESRWSCVWVGGPEPRFDACGTVWNTFATHGRCPGCAHQWQWTSCLRCGGWSPHVDWYEDGEPDA